MSDNKKRDEWRQLMAKCGNEIDTSTFIEQARNPKSEFHEDFEWKEEKQVEQYLHKRAAQLIRYYSTAFNKESTEQRLYPIPMAGRIRRYKTAKKILRTEEDVKIATAYLWGRLRMVMRDIQPFVTVVPEFKKIFDFVDPIVSPPEIGGTAKGKAAR